MLLAYHVPPAFEYCLVGGTLFRYSVYTSNQPWHVKTCYITTSGFLTANEKLKSVTDIIEGFHEASMLPILLSMPINVNAEYDTTTWC